VGDSGAMEGSVCNCSLLHCLWLVAVPAVAVAVAVMVGCGGFVFFCWGVGCPNFAEGEL
jgi:hypothetical protein